MKRLLIYPAVIAAFSIPALSFAGTDQPGAAQTRVQLSKVAAMESPDQRARLSDAARPCEHGALPVYSHTTGQYWCAAVGDYDQIAGSTQQ